MKRFVVCALTLILGFFSLFSFSVFAETGSTEESVETVSSTAYLPDSESDEYLPTVKIFTYSLGYDGNLIAEGFGSGTLIDDVGTVVTNNHVVQDYYDPTSTYDAFQICLTKGNDPDDPVCEFTASMIVRDADRDIALLAMDKTDVRGNEVGFDFYLPTSDATPGIGDTVTVIGYPDTGGKTVTFTSGLISGFLTEGVNTYIKTDADISFGNSGGTAVVNDAFVGIPTYIMGSYSSEVLGYLVPVADILDWIEQNKNDGLQTNEVAHEELRSKILAYITANETKHYQNDYPPYKIALVEGWRFGNSLEGSFDYDNSYGFGYYSSADSLSILPVDQSEISPLSITISVTDYAYEVTLEDLMNLFDSYYQDYYKYDESIEDDDYSLEETVFNDKYPAVKESSSYVDWWYLNGETIYTDTYYIPYGDQAINVSYSYADSDVEEGRLNDVNDILSTFVVSMDAVVSSVVNFAESDDPDISLSNPLDDAYLADNSYDYDGEHYFSVSFGKKDDYTFSVSVSSGTYWDERYEGDFDLFKKETMDSVEQWSEVVADGDMTIDGHRSFFYTDVYEDYYGGGDTYSTNIYVENDKESYFSIYYSSEEDKYNESLGDFDLILKSIELSNNGEGEYKIPDFLGKEKNELKDIEHYIYEDNIRSLVKNDAFTITPVYFNPASPMTRHSFVVWAVRTLQGDAATDFAEFEEAYERCSTNCFEDVDYASDQAVYIEYARSKDAVGGLADDGKYYFSPSHQVSLMAALKIIFELNDFDVWKAPEYVQWYIPYLHLGYVNGAIPYGALDPTYMVNRGEGAFIIDTVNMVDVCDDYYCY